MHGRALRLVFVDHLARHAAVDDDIGAGDEARALAVEQEGDHVGDIVGLADTPRWMLRMVAPLERRIACRLDPAGTDAVHAHVRSKTDSEGMSESGYAAFRSGVGFGVRLRHP